MLVSFCSGFIKQPFKAADDLPICFRSPWQILFCKFCILIASSWSDPLCNLAMRNFSAHIFACVVTANCISRKLGIIGYFLADMLLCIEIHQIWITVCWKSIIVQRSDENSKMWANANLIHDDKGRTFFVDTKFLFKRIGSGKKVNLSWLKKLFSHFVIFDVNAFWHWQWKHWDHAPMPGKSYEEKGDIKGRRSISYKQLTKYFRQINRL